jgi:predicted metal-binding membrane protein
LESDPRAEGLAPALAAARARLGLVVLLFALAGIGWWWTAEQMRGMDQGPWTGLGTADWFLGVWIVMMAAMMFPSVSPTVALYSRMTLTRSPVSPLLFAAGYLLTWAAAGVLAFAVGKVVFAVAGNELSWSNGGRAVAGATLLLAAVYQLTPLKDVCLGKCRSPLDLLLAVRMGVKNGGWCVGCCWALMALLFALGAMSIAWMAFVAGLIAFENTIPWRRAATYGTTLARLPRRAHRRRPPCHSRVHRPRQPSHGM